MLWKTDDIGRGYSTPAVVEDRLYVMANEGLDNEFVEALDAANGKRVWSTRVGKVGNPKQQPNFPAVRSTPTVDDGAIYVLSSDGDLACLERKTGHIRWQKNVRAEFGGKPGAIVYPLTLVVAALLLLAAAEMGAWHDYVVGVICALGWFAVFFAMNLASPRLLGFGDVRLSLVLGLSLGWLGVGYVLLGFFAANLIGAVVGIGLIASKRVHRQSRIPYGVFLASGCAVAVFAGPVLLRPFTNHSI